jgi:type IV secretory pathway VirB3-like protein
MNQVLIFMSWILAVVVSIFIFAGVFVVATKSPRFYDLFALARRRGESLKNSLFYAWVML